MLRFFNLCPRWESNPHPLRDTILSRARIPVPPLGQTKHINVLNNRLPSCRPPPSSWIKYEAVHILSTRANKTYFPPSYNYIIFKKLQILLYYPDDILSNDWA